MGEQISRGQLGKKISTTSTAALRPLHPAEFSMKAIRVRKDPIEVTMDEAQWLFWPRAAEPLTPRTTSRAIKGHRLSDVCAALHFHILLNVPMQRVWKLWGWRKNLKNHKTRIHQPSHLKSPLSYSTLHSLQCTIYSASSPGSLHL